jgi:hypothetical protein
MRRRMLLQVVALWAVSSAGGAQQPTAQSQPPRPGVVVVSYNKCGLDKVGRLDSLSALAFYPVLDEVVREGRLLSWGVLTHDWGDEWNFVVYYTATNVNAFHSAWGEIVRRVRERRPNFMADFAPYCTEHKDNIYGVLRAATATPPPAPR